MTQRLIILGTGGSVYDILDIVSAINAQNPTWDVVGYLDDAREVGSTFLNIPVLGRLVDASKYPDCKFINAIGSVGTYLRRAELIASTGLAMESFVSLVHPAASISTWARIGIGAYISYGVCVGGAAIIGDFVSICPSVVIGHDSIIGDYSVIAPGACISGYVTIAPSVYIGSRVVIRQRQKIGKGALIGMGAVVVSDIDAGATVVGVPARLLRRRTSQSDRNPAFPGIDVIIPCYKYGKFLEACVQSVLSQQGVNPRVLILDDASPDNTEEVGRRLAARDSRVEFRKHILNRGHIATYNEGIEWAESKYMLLLSADDLITPGSLRRATGLMEANPKVGLVYGDAIKTADPLAETPVPDNAPFTTTVVPGREFLQAACITAENLVPTPTAVVRTELQKKVGGYRRDLPHSGDFEMWMRFGATGDIGVVHAVQAYYRMHGENMSVAYPMPRDIEERKATFDVLFDTFESQITDGGKLRALAYRSLAESTFWHGSHSFDDGDMTACRNYLKLALRIDPGFAGSREYRRFKLKSMVGTHMWGVIRPMVSMMRGNRGASQSRADAALVVQG